MFPLVKKTHRHIHVKYITTVTINYPKPIITTKKGPIGYVMINRPTHNNAINSEVERELMIALKDLDNNADTKCIIITGNGKSFSAGADISQMAKLTSTNIHGNELFSKMREITNIKIPIVAAVNGYAFGGGCELAMMCDIIIASDKAVFSQSEINLGTIPGIGGTQRLTKCVGKYKAMELILTGDIFDAYTAKDMGLVCHVVSSENLMHEAEKIALKIASKSRPISILAKECVNESFETTLKEGITFEKHCFGLTFGTKDKSEGMNAFLEKRLADSINRYKLL